MSQQRTRLDSRRADLRTTASSWNPAPNQQYSANFGSANQSWKNYSNSWITFSRRELSGPVRHHMPPQYCSRRRRMEDSECVSTTARSTGSPSSHVTQSREPTNFSTNFAAPSSFRKSTRNEVTIRFASPSKIVTRRHFEPDTIATSTWELLDKCCDFLKQELEFLGHIVSTEGVKIDPKKIKTIQKWKPPSNIKELQSFLSFVNYVRRFIPNMVGICDVAHSAALIIWLRTLRNAEQQ
ncbi:hypothetical protein CLOM_g11527 [Closterium sp. NIES-68]|nr:hypothetical protein CLOM_g11527 [Closterium sp. NIES-68]